jgi:hypothetical protein
MEATDYILADMPERESAVAQDAATRENSAISHDG